MCVRQSNTSLPDEVSRVRWVYEDDYRLRVASLDPVYLLPVVCAGGGGGGSFE